jgi:hypothetical protein
MIAVHGCEDTGLTVGLKPGVMIAGYSTERPWVDIKALHDHQGCSIQRTVASQEA